jgi:hypothetical protein
VLKIASPILHVSFLSVIKSQCILQDPTKCVAVGTSLRVLMQQQQQLDTSHDSINYAYFVRYKWENVKETQNHVKMQENSGLSAVKACLDLTNADQPHKTDTKMYANGQMQKVDKSIDFI